MSRSKGFYARLAADNIKKNSKTYVPYMLTCIITVAMFYMIRSLSMNEGLSQLKRGMRTMPNIMYFGSIVTGIFAAIFLFYTSSFLMKRRKKEFGLFNVLGMEKRHIARVVALETLYAAVISLTLGLCAGIGLDKLMFLAVTKMIGAEVVLGFYISTEAMLNALILFGIVFFLIMLNSVRQIHFSNPAELLRGGSTGEREPKTKWIMTFLSVLCLGGGYVISLSDMKVSEIPVKFFLAVILVVAGTYMLFTAGSVFALKALKKNKKYYYKTKHFISVSGLIYRMKQNAAGLANICILSTMVLVMISSTTSVMLGIEDILNYQYPADVAVRIFGAYGGSAEQAQDIRKALEEYADIIDIKGDYPVLSVSCSVEGDMVVLGDMWSVNLDVITAEAYRQRYGENISLNEGEAAIFTDGTDFSGETIDLFGESYRVTQNSRSRRDSRISHSYGLVDITVALKDEKELEAADRRYQAFFKNEDGECYLDHRINFNVLDVSREEEIIDEIRRSGDGFAYISSVGEERDDFMDIYGSLFFLGIFLGVLFIMAAILIMYYKQISEGYDDKGRFEIMRKVGLSRNEVKSAIHSQVLLVFFLPLITAGVHLGFAFPIISRMMTEFGFMNTELYMMCAIGSFLVFGVIYAAVYLVTARVYYRIVSM